MGIFGINILNSLGRTLGDNCEAVTLLDVQELDGSSYFLRGFLLVLGREDFGV